MAKADGRIIIDTRIDESGIEADTKKLYAALQSLTARVETLGKTMQKALAGDPKAIEAYRAQATALRQELQALQTQMNNMGSGTMSTEGFKNMQAIVDNLNDALAQMDGLVDTVAGGTGRLSKVWSVVGTAARGVGGVIKGVVSGAASLAVKVVKGAVSAIKSAISGIASVARKVFSGVVSAIKRVGAAAASLAKTVGRKLLSAFKTVGGAVKSLFSRSRDLSGSLGGVTKSIKRLVPAMLSAQGVFGILSKAVNAFMDSNEQVAGQLSACWTNLGNVLGPIITYIVNLVSTAIAYVTAFLRLFGLGGGGGVKTISGAGKAVGGLSSATKVATVSAAGYKRTAVAAFKEAGGAAKVASVQVAELGDEGVAACAAMDETVAVAGDGMQTIAAGATAAADEIHQVGDEAKKTDKQLQNLSGLDQLNTWKTQQEAGGGGGGGGGIGDLGVAVPEVTLPDWVKQMAEAMKAGAWGEAAHILTDNLNAMVDNVDWDGIGSRFGKKAAGILHFFAETIRGFDFTGLFRGIFTSAKTAIEEVDADDIGTLLATKFIVLFSAVKGALESGLIPTLAQKAAGAVSGFFKTIREKFAEGTNDSGWYTVGQTFGNAGRQIINGVAAFLNGVTWDDIKADITAFWNGLKDALRGGSNGPDWTDIFAGLRTSLLRMFVTFRGWIPSKSEASSQFWAPLEDKLEKGDNITWSDIFHALVGLLTDLGGWLAGKIPSTPAAWKEFWDGLKEKIAHAAGHTNWDEMVKDLKGKFESWKKLLRSYLPTDWATFWEGLKENIAGFLTGGEMDWDEMVSALDGKFDGWVDKLKEYLPGGEKWTPFWTALKEKIAEAVGEESWDSLTESVRSKVEGALIGAFELVMEALYQFVSGKSETMAALLFPNRAAVDAAATNFKGYLKAGSIEAAQSQLNAMVSQGTITNAEAQRLAAEMGYAYANGILTALPEGESAARHYTESVTEEMAPLYEDDGSEPTVAKKVTDSIVENTPVAAEAAQELANSMEKVTDSAGDMAAAADEATGQVSSGFQSAADTVTDENATASDDTDSQWAAIKQAVSDAARYVASMIGATWNGAQLMTKLGNQAMADEVGKQWTAIKRSVQNAMKAVSSDVQSKSSSIQTTLASTFSSIADTIGSKMGSAASSVENAVSRMKTALSKTLTGPSLRLPHVSVSGSFSLQPPSAPKFSVSWYRKAMNEAMILDGATIFGAAGGKLLGGGESGREVVAGEKHLIALIVKAVRGAMGSIEISKISLDSLERAGDRFISKFDQTMDKLQAIVDSADFRLPTVATAGVVPYSVSGGTAVRGGAGGQEDKLDRLISLMERLVSNDGGRTRGENRYTFIGELDGKVLFQKVVAEGQAARRSTGKNPFMLGGDR